MADVCFVVFSFGAEICGRGLLEELQAKALGSEFRVLVGPEMHPLAKTHCRHRQLEAVLTYVLSRPNSLAESTAAWWLMFGLSCT